MRWKVEKPLTKEEVLKMIEEHGGPVGLDLSEKNLEGIDLSSDRDGPSLDMHSIILRFANLQEADLQYANLEEADLRSANLHKAYLWGAKLRNAFLWSAQLQDADLQMADLSGADMTFANLEGANLSFCTLSKIRLYNAKI
jgi:uncharacterized protein YjbI with pentapeptide repeats